MNLRLLTLGAASLALCSIIMFAPHNASFMDRGMDVIASNRDAVSRESELRLLFGSEFVRLPVNEIYGDVHLEFTPKHSNIFEVEGALLAFHTAFVVHDHEVGRLDEVFHQHIKLHKQDYEAVNSPQSIASSLASPGFLASSGWQKIDQQKIKLNFFKIRVACLTCFEKVLFQFPKEFGGI